MINTRFVLYDYIENICFVVQPSVKYIVPYAVIESDIYSSGCFKKSTVADINLLLSSRTNMSCVSVPSLFSVNCVQYSWNNTQPQVCCLVNDY